AWSKGRGLLDPGADVGTGIDPNPASTSKPLSYQVSELHLCADVAGQGVDALRREDFVHRGSIACWHANDAQLLDLVEGPARVAGAHDEGRPLVELHIRHGETEGISFSKTAPHACALYNEPREIRYKSRDKLWFADLWRRHGWDKVLTRARKVSLLLPCCDTSARWRTSVNELKHFYHPKGTGCETAEETVEHVLAKAIVLQACRAAGYTAVTEWAENDWHTDVMAWCSTH